MWHSDPQPGNLEPHRVALLELVLDELDYGILLLTGKRFVHHNRAAKLQLQEADCPLQLRGEQIRAAYPPDDRQLDAALKGAARSGRRCLLTLRADTRVLQIAVVPLDAAPSESGAVMVLMGKREVCARLSAHWFCRSHRLTPAEAGVLTDLLAGHPPRDIATRNGVAMSTVRTQIASIKGKTATRGIRELLMMAAALPPVVPVLMTQAV